LIFIHADALLQILDKKSNKGQEILEKLEKSKDVFAITSLTLYDVQSFLIERAIDILPPSVGLLQVYGFAKEDAKKAIELKCELKKKSIEIYSSDLQVSSIVMNKGGTLCTMDNRLKILEEWGLKLFFV
jgi:predicted nucleic acid-binding protein